VLKVARARRDRGKQAGLAAVATGTALSAGYPLLAKPGVVAEEASGVFRLGGGATTAGAGCRSR
jgi:hypothetical protein